MARLRRFLVRLINVVRFTHAEDEMNREVASHLAMMEDDFRRKGMTAEEARLAARRAFGGVEQVKEAHRDARQAPWLADLGWDIRYAIRVLRKSPGFTVVAVGILAIGIGVNGAVFTVANAALFQGFRAVNRNDRLLYIYSGDRNGGYTGVSYPDFDDWRTQTKSFEELGVVGDLKVLCDGNEFRDVCSATRITWNGFRLLGRAPILGRDFTAADDRLGAAPVAILSYGFWARQFGKDPAVIGRTLRLGIADQIHQNGEGPPTTMRASTPQTTIIGVMPKGFAFPQDQDLWVPLVPMTPDVQQRDARNLWFAFGRLVDGATRETSQADLQRIGGRLASMYPPTNIGQVPRVETFTEFFLERNAPTIYKVLWAAVGFVLLIACANLANLLLARAAGRSREISIRRALGAGRWRIVRQLLIEGLVLSVAGGLCGWVLATWDVHVYALATNPPVGQWNHDLLEYSTDVHAVSYLAAISLGSGLLFSLAPALWFSRLDLRASLRDEGAGAIGGRQGRRLSDLLVIVEVSLAVVLLSAASLMIRSFLNLYRADLGADTANVAAMLLRMPEAKYPTQQSHVAFYDRLKTHLESTPGVKSAALGAIPAGGISRGVPYELAGAAAVDAEHRPATGIHVIGPDYFRTVDARMLTGREFTPADGPSALPVVVVNQQFANQYWPGATAIGQSLRVYNGDTPDAWLTVVGVVSNVMQDSRRQAVTPMLYVPFAQAQRAGEDPWLLIRAALPGAGVLAMLRREVHAVDPDVVIWLGPSPLRDRLMLGIYGSTRNQTVLLSIFAVIAVLLASVGIYAVLAHAVSRRTKEMGVRAALGATAGDIVTLVFRQGMLPVMIGVLIGAAGALIVAPVLKSELISVSTADPLAFLAASVALTIAAALGCLIPARRATKVDPMVALRYE